MILEDLQKFTFRFGKRENKMYSEGWNYISLVKKLKGINSYLIYTPPTSKCTHCILTNLDASKTF